MNATTTLVTQWTLLLLEGRLDGVMEVFKSKPEMYEIIIPDLATETDILRAHSRNHYEYIKRNPLLVGLAALAAGGAIMAAEIALYRIRLIIRSSQFHFQ